MTRPADPLATVAPQVADLLARVDHVLLHYGVCTAYPQHQRVLDGLREFAALPGAAFDHIRHVDPAALAGSIGIHGLVGSYQETAGGLGAVVGGLYWGGPARDAFDGYWTRLVGYLDGGQGPPTTGRVSMVDVVAAAAGYGDGIVAWWRGIRAAVVRFFRATMENGIAVALAGVEVGAPLDLAARAGTTGIEPAGTGLPAMELPEIEGFERVSLAATHGADLFLGAVGTAVRREPVGQLPGGELAYPVGSARPAARVTGQSWVRVGEQDTVDG
jgi:hypothetical protein